MIQPENDKPAFNLYAPISGIENPLCGAVFSSATLQPILQAPDPKWNDLLGNPGLDQDCLQSCRIPLTASCSDAHSIPSAPTANGCPNTATIRPAPTSRPTTTRPEPVTDPNADWGQGSRATPLLFTIRTKIRRA